MKRSILIAVIAATISISAKAQEKSEVVVDTIPVVDGAHQFQEIVKVDTTFKKDQLYKNAKAYFMNVFTGAKDAFQYDDKKEGKIVGKGFVQVSDIKRVFPAVAVLKWDVYYNLEVTCKDGKYRYRLYDIVITKEAHVSENTFRNVHLTIDDAYGNIPKQRGSYKTLYPKVINKLIAELETNITGLKENMAKKKVDYSAAF
ncbi:MAG TPA: DUF4468 domain-containing protein [Mucilaginibacter sp.]|jgi:hypothetical protein